MKEYKVKPLIGKESIKVEVPGSKSITNRALMLAALGNQTCELRGVLFSDDSRAFLSCLQELGFDVVIVEEQKKVRITGLGGVIPNRTATINVRSAGTAARFLTVMLAFAGGCYTLNSSEQMKKRPMEPLLSELRKAGVKITCLEKEGHFPFVIESNKVNIRELTIDTNISSQFASALLMSATLLPDGLTLHMSGERSSGAYVLMTLSMMEQFGIQVTKNGADCEITTGQTYGLSEYDIEPDMSAACYFYAMAAILNRKVTVLGTHEEISLQGDKKFLGILRELGCTVEDLSEGVTVTGVSNYPGITVNMKDFSDQALTMAVVAAFADSPTRIEHVGHIRMQESDRIQAMINELNRMGVGCKELTEADGVEIIPAPIQPAEIETYEDHRVAMSFALAGLRAEGIVIKNPLCCGKTFENYFEVIDSLYEEEL
ncbi:MAG: 3-phosphoshikimate 1-carboxyvinyltransferase [Lachnospiraceae bacterium]|nr:3-phosphoshikimate 1-carboxyvinyltransferase [Lachnospiraceae bacterium]